jgi:hypothetical protein
VYFSYIFHKFNGFPPDKELTSTSITYLVLSLFFFLLPFAQKLKLGSFLEYEAKIERLNTDVKEFKEEVRQFIQLQNNLINTVSNSLNQNIHISVPGMKEVQAAKEELNETIPETQDSDSIERKIDAYLATEGLDLTFALAKLRIDLEKELRRILGMRTETNDPLEMKQAFLSAGALFRKFISKYPKYSGMGSSFDYILKICNAALHGQSISIGHSHEALHMGFRMLEELKKIY